MLDRRYVREHAEEVRKALENRGVKDFTQLDAFLELEKRSLELRAETEAAQAELNQLSSSMASVDKKSQDFADRRAALGELSKANKSRAVKLTELDARAEEALLHLPNLPHPSTPIGKSEHDNVVVRTWGEKPKLDFAPKDHVALGAALDIIDFERAVKVSGARFSILKGMGARLERALMMFMLDLHTREHGYEELWPPALVRDSALRGTGQLPKFEHDQFKVARHYEEGDAAERVVHYLSPTAEVQLTNYHADEIFEPGVLPKAYCAYAPCFRSEAGSYGKDTRGLIRQHQFDKVELVHFCAPEQGEAMLDQLVKNAETVLVKLGLAYRVVQLCTGDMGNGSQKSFDLEVWLPGQDAYREISSCSWFGEYQSRRAKIRYRPEVGAKPRLAHTLNGSGLAIGRTLVAILEQYQRADGSVSVPEALRSYVGTDRIA
jgi:seryl-tRNA synthetase